MLLVYLSDILVYLMVLFVAFVIPGGLTIWNILCFIAWDSVCRGRRLVQANKCNGVS